jgi:hypothetical protein
MGRHLKIGDKAPEGIGLDIQDEQVMLSSLWHEGPTLLTFLRHFG